VKSKLIGAGLIAGATWVAYNRLSEPTPFYSPYADAATQILRWWVRRARRDEGAGARTRREARCGPADLSVR
jgi:hypothetical protein